MGWRSLFPRRRYKNLRMDLFAQPSGVSEEYPVDKQEQMTAEEFAECLRRLPDGAVLPNSKLGAIVGTKPAPATTQEAEAPLQVQQSSEKTSPSPEQPHCLDKGLPENESTRAQKTTVKDLRPPSVDPTKTRTERVASRPNPSIKRQRRSDQSMDVPRSVQSAVEAMRKAEAEADALVGALLRNLA